MLGYLSLDIILSSKLTVWLFRNRWCRWTNMRAYFRSKWGLLFIYIYIFIYSLFSMFISNVRICHANLFSLVPLTAISSASIVNSQLFILLSVGILNIFCRFVVFRCYLYGSPCILVNYQTTYQIALFFFIILLTSGVAFAVVVCLQVNFISALSVFSQLGLINNAKILKTVFPHTLEILQIPIHHRWRGLGAQ